MSPHGPEAGDRVAFLVGAGRSGTTLLYKLLALHPDVAYISNYENRLQWFPDGIAARIAAPQLEGKLNAWFNHGNAYFVERPWLKRIFPTPHEGEPVYASCGIRLFPQRDELPDRAAAERLRTRFERIRRRARASVLVSKRTANNRRVRQLEAIFPRARYVHLVRDGREVTQSLSTVEWWDRHTVWWDGRTPVEIERSGEPRLAVCARNWVREIEELRQQLAIVPPERVLTLRFEELLEDPLLQLERVVRFLGVAFTSEYRMAIETLSLRPVRAKWDSAWDTGQLACVMRETQPLLRQLGYTD